MGKRPMVWFLCSFFAGMILIRYQQRGAPDFVFWIESFIVLLFVITLVALTCYLVWDLMHPGVGLFQW